MAETDRDDPWDPLHNASDAEPPSEVDGPPADGSSDEPWTLADDRARDSDAGTYTLRIPEPPRPAESHAETSGARSETEQAEPSQELAAARPRKRRRKRKRRDRTQPRPIPHLSLRSALRYPLTGAGPAVLAVYALGMGMSRLLPIVGPLLALVVLTYLGMLLLETAHDTLEDVPGGPRFPGIDLADLEVGLFGLAVMLIGMLPYVIGRSILSRLGGESAVWELLLWPLPLYYLPLAYVVLADVQSERGLDPRLVFRAMGQIGGLYFILVTLAASAFLVPAVTLSLLQLPRPLLEPINSFVILYVMVALLRAAGLLSLRRGIVTEDSGAAAVHAPAADDADHVQDVSEETA